MGPEGMGALVDQFTNVAPVVRMQIATTLVSPAQIYRGDNHTDTNQIPADIMVDGLSRIAQDSMSMFRIPAIQRLGMFGTAASNAVPALLQIAGRKDPLVRHMAIRALVEIKAQPDLVVAALTNLLTDSDPGTQMAAVSALCAFGYNAEFRPHVPNLLAMPAPAYVPGRTNLLVPTDHTRPVPRN